MTEEFNDKEFLDDINSIPSWIRSEKDFFTYCRHITYRLRQAQAALKFYNKLPLSEEQIREVKGIYYDYEKAYNNSPSPEEPTGRTSYF